MMFGQGRANRGISFSYNSEEISALHHVKKKAGKNSKFPNYKIRNKLFDFSFKF